jgi:hypothetical protein
MKASDVLTESAQAPEAKKKMIVQVEEQLSKLQSNDDISDVVPRKIDFVDEAIEEPEKVQHSQSIDFCEPSRSFNDTN